jgi:hypothetical protein
MRRSSQSYKTLFAHARPHRNVDEYSQTSVGMSQELAGAFQSLMIFDLKQKKSVVRFCSPSQVQVLVSLRVYHAVTAHYCE